MSFYELKVFSKKTVIPISTKLGTIVLSVKGFLSCSKILMQQKEIIRKKYPKDPQSLGLR
jgi:hypothetical protein